MALKIAVLKNNFPGLPEPLRGALGELGYRRVRQARRDHGKRAHDSFFLSAAGSMDSLDESFLPNDRTGNREARLHHRPEKGFENSILEELHIVREERPDLSVPIIRSVAGEDDSGTIRSGGMVQIKGLRLRFDPMALGQGLFFADSTGAEVRSHFYPIIMPGTVLASVPDFPCPGYLCYHSSRRRER